MTNYSFKFFQNNLVLYLKERLCETNEEFTKSKLFTTVLNNYIDHLLNRKSSQLDIFPGREINDRTREELLETLQYLSTMKYDYVLKVYPASAKFLEDRYFFTEFISGLYDYWRNFNRFVITHSDDNTLAKRPYRTFTSSIEAFNHLTRKVYRDTTKNLTLEHPKVYRQVCAGGECGAITSFPKQTLVDKYFNVVKRIPQVRQLLLYPPLILYPTMNKRKGKFVKRDTNPIDKLDINPKEWMCFPVKSGKYLINAYVHENFMALGFSLSNLFELADEDDLQRKPDAVYFFGAPKEAFQDYANSPCEFYEDKENDLVIAAVPNDDQFGYFGYLKKMILTLHNIKVMQEKGLPFHGAFMEIKLKNGKSSKIMVIGDTGSGKSETIDAMQRLGEEHIDSIEIIADDMGSIFIEDGKTVAYGTETGAFMRLDDLGPGYALGQLDRSIIMSPREVNSRIIIPVNSYRNVIKKHHIDYVFYANNYSKLEDSSDALSFFDDYNEALDVFRAGRVMSKGTTATKGEVQNYFANIFGPPEYKELHDDAANKVFSTFFKTGVKVGEIRTQLGVQGMEHDGPLISAREILDLIREVDKKKANAAKSSNETLAKLNACL